MADYSRYKEQFDALMTELGEFEHECEQLSFPRWDKILELVRGLKWFAEGQFLFFYYGFSDERPSDYPKLNPQISASNRNIQFPPEHVLATTLAQLEADLSVIQLAALPRIHFGSAENLDRFAALDEFVQASLWHGKQVFDEYLDRKTVLTYLTDSVQVRVVPYASVVFIGVPASIGPNSQKSNAIAHEIGHFRFYHSFPQTGDASATSGANVPSWVRDLQAPRLNLRELFYPFVYTPELKASPTAQWAEEIFADVYGVWFGGPEYIKTAMDMALEHSTKGLVDFDFNAPHPTPLIRPMLMVKAIGALNKGPLPLLPVEETVANAQAIALSNAWKRKLQARGILYSKAPEHDSDDLQDLQFKFTDETLAANVGKTIAWDTRDLDLRFYAEELVAKAVQALRFAVKDSPLLDVLWGWGDRQAAIEKVKEFFDEEQEFSDVMQRLRVILTRRPWPPGLHIAQPSPTLIVPAQAQWTDWAINQKGYFEKGFFDRTELAEMYAGDFDTVMNPATRPTNTWLPVFGASGWTTEGPCVMPPH